VAEAKRLTGQEFKGKEIVIIGDTPNDVLCGKPLGVRTIAVATSNYTLEQLQAESPDYLFADLTDKTKVLSALLDPLPA
jgi:phosphoglycolate phosphatase-like HAD superfamily hydrolase